MHKITWPKVGSVYRSTVTAVGSYHGDTLPPVFLEDLQTIMKYELMAVFEKILLLFLQGVFCNPEAAESNRHRPGSEREGYFLYGSHGVSPWQPPAGGAAGCFGDIPGQVKE